MLEAIMDDFSKHVHTHYYPEISKSEWGINHLHKTSAAFGYKPTLIGHDVSEGNFKEHKALFMFVWNEFDQMLYVNMERYFDKDIEKFSKIYEDLLAFLSKNGTECLVSVFCYDHFSTIKDMENAIPLSFTGENSKVIYEMLSVMPTFKEEVPVLHINFDGIQYNDWDTTFYTLSVKTKEPSIEVVNAQGEKTATLLTVKDAQTFVNKYLF